MASPIRPKPPGYTNPTPTPTRDKTGMPLPPKPYGTMGGTPGKPIALVKPKPGTPGRGRGGATPPPGMMYGPNDALIPIPKKGGGTPVRDSRGGSPVRVMGGSPTKMGPGPVRTGAPVMRAKGGMVKSSSKKK